MAEHPSQAPGVDERAVLAAFSAEKVPRTYDEISEILGLKVGPLARSLLSRRMRQLVRQGLMVHIDSPDLLRRLGAIPEDHDRHSKFWAVTTLLPEDVREELATQATQAAASPEHPQLTELGVLLEAQLIASGMAKNAYLAEREIAPRVWWRLITPGQSRPRPTTVIKYATLVGADVAKALEAAGYDPRLAELLTMEAKQGMSQD